MVFLRITFISVVALAWLVLASSCGNTSAAPNQDFATADSAMVKKLFEQRCGICHGGDGRTPITGAKDLAESVLARDEVMERIMNGKGTMPPFKHLPADQLEALTNFTLALRK